MNTYLVVDHNELWAIISAESADAVNEYVVHGTSLTPSTKLETLDLHFEAADQRMLTLNRIKFRGCHKVKKTEECVNVTIKVTLPKGSSTAEQLAMCCKNHSAMLDSVRSVQVVYTEIVHLETK